MRAEIEIGADFNSGMNGTLLRNCSISSGETAASQKYVQGFMRNIKQFSFADSNIKAAFRSRREPALFFLAAEEDSDTFQIWKVLGSRGEPVLLFEELEKKSMVLNFSWDYGKLNYFTDMDCIIVCAFGTLLAFSEENEEMLLIPTDSLEGDISGICAFANRMVATVANSGNADYYYWSPVVEPTFGMSRENPGYDKEKSPEEQPGVPATLATGAGRAASEYGNDITLAARRTGSRLAIFTSKTIEIKDVSSDPEMPFQGYLYQNNYDMGAFIPTIVGIGGTLYFIGEEMSGLRFACSLSDGELKKLTTAAQSSLFDGEFTGAGISQDGTRTFYNAYGSRNFGLDILNGSLHEIESSGGEEVLFFEYLRDLGRILKIAPSGLYLSGPGSGDYAAFRLRLPKQDLGGPASIGKLSFIGEFMESGTPAVATLTAERGYSQRAAAHSRGFDFFLIGIQRLNDLEFSSDANFRLTKIIVDYQILKNFSMSGG